MAKCPKCGGDCSVSYHDGQSYDEGRVICRIGFMRLRHQSSNEHLHYYCPTCGYDFVGETKGEVKAN
jgi:rRNA maturation protein Nop10